MLAGVKTPDENPIEMAIAGASDIYANEGATLWVPSIGTLEVEVKGFRTVGDQEMIVIELPPGVSQVKSGCSGSPVVQKGKIIGFVAATQAIPFRGPKQVILRPACQVYSELIGTVVSDGLLD